MFYKTLYLVFFVTIAKKELVKIKNLGNAKARFSQQLILKALLSLMQEKAFSSITIEEITLKAQLSRRTFYRNFKRKEDVLDIEVQSICDDYRKNVHDVNDLSLSEITYLFFKTMDKHFPFLYLLKKQNLLQLYITQIDNISFMLFEEHKKTLINSFGAEIVEYALLFSVGGFGYWLECWLGMDNRKSPDEMREIMKKILILVNDPRNKKT